MGHISLFQSQAPLHGCSLVQVGRRQFCFTHTISWTMPSTWEVTVTNTGVGGCSSVGCCERAVSVIRSIAMWSPSVSPPRCLSSWWKTSFFLVAFNCWGHAFREWEIVRSSPTLLFYAMFILPKEGSVFICSSLYSSLHTHTHTHTHTEQETNSKISRGSVLWFPTCWMSMFHLRVYSWKQMLD